MDYTQEQKDIINYTPEIGETIKVQAFAGTGKTSTLRAYTGKRPNRKFLYVCFNKAIQEYAAKVFGPNTDCKTIHSLAWSRYAGYYKNKLVQSLKATTVNDVLGYNDYVKSRFALDTLQRYLISADHEINETHIPHMAKFLYRKNKEELVKAASDIWEIMTDPEDDNIGIVHDGYLKLFQLSEPKLSKYDTILIDEAQDVNPITYDVLSRQVCSHLLVGDPHQSIYKFRGAEDIMSKIKSARSFYLTQSFRFSKSIGILANLILWTFKGETKKVKGHAGRQGHIGKVTGNHTVICRTNAAVFELASSMLSFTKIGLVGGINTYRFGELLESYYLYDGQIEKITTPYIKAFNTFKAMKQFAEDVEDVELTGRVKLVERYKGSIPVLLHKIREATVSVDTAEVIFSTAHKIKGLEFPSVRVNNDFVKLVNSKGQIIDPEDITPEEINLIYVACTRSLGNLELPPKIVEFVKALRADRMKN